MAQEPLKLKLKPTDPIVRGALRLFFRGPVRVTTPSEVIDRLVSWGWVIRVEGWATLSREGLRVALRLGIHNEERR